ncbi:hypothetical protein [Halobacillus sp. Marseille-Q1614]|uniref:hypothetical protein n=1 Tax=Halobacillus sp. Marseille-Q1614 TaxID=2709134 RepID=UPI00156E163D|nr:hypothetical protein [Halobacillus sp. Marseille-Q1614]
MKKYLIIVGLATLIGCSQSTSANETIEEKPTQQELNEKLREEATAIDFAAINAGKVEIGEKVSIIGGITEEEGTESSIFTVTTKEEDGYGTYTVESMAKDADYQTGEIVEVFGTYQGTDEDGTPLIESPVIDAVK